MNNVMELTPEIAKMIINEMRKGTPPRFGFEHFSSGFEDIFYHLEKEYLQEIVLKGGSTFKFVSASFGTGKTHFSLQFREMAWKHNYVTCYVELDSKNKQFNKILNVYQEICKQIQRPLDDKEKMEIFGDLKKPEEFGIGNMIKFWYHTKQNEFQNMYKEEWKIYLKKYIETVRGFDSIYFGRVIRQMLKSLIDEDEDTFEDLELWFQNGGNDRYKEFGIKKQIEGDTFRMLNSLTKLLRDFMKFAGLVIFFDEGEPMTLSTKERSRQLNTLRQVVDKCGDQSISSTMLFYTVPNEADFLESAGGGLDALKQRLSKYFSQEHPMSPNINLEKLTPSDDHVKENWRIIGKKMGHLYEIAEKVPFTDKWEKSIDSIVEKTFLERFSEFSGKRLFIQTVCQGLDIVSKDPNRTITDDDAENLAKNKTSDDGLNDREY